MLGHRKHSRQGHSSFAGHSSMTSNHATSPGARYGRWLVIQPATANKYCQKQWICRCDCGNERVIAQGDLRRGTSRSCGCLKLELSAVRMRRQNFKHGDCPETGVTAEYNAWHSMLQRCYNAASENYHRYGGRGISVYELWKHSYAAFLAHVGRRPSPLYSLERINNNGNYEPGNVRWATATEQCRNKCNNVRLTFNGETLLLVEWANRLNLTISGLKRRINCGWSLERALTTPAIPRQEYIRYAQMERWKGKT